MNALVTSDMCPRANWCRRSRYCLVAARLLAAVAQTKTSDTGVAGRSSTANKSYTWLEIKTEVTEFEAWKGTKKGKYIGVESFINEMDKNYTKVVMQRWQKWLKEVERAGALYVLSLRDIY